MQVWFTMYRGRYMLNQSMDVMSYEKNPKPSTMVFCLVLERNVKTEIVGICITFSPLQQFTIPKHMFSRWEKTTTGKTLLSQWRSHSQLGTLPKLLSLSVELQGVQLARLWRVLASGDKEKEIMTELKKKKTMRTGLNRLDYYFF